MAERLVTSITQERVRYSETDKMGVAHHSSYVGLLEAGRVALCRQCGIPYSDIESQGYNIAVVDLSIRYLTPLFFDESITIETTLEKASPRFFHFSYRILNEKGDIAVKAFTKHIVVNRSLAKTSLPSDIINCFKRGIHA